MRTSRKVMDRRIRQAFALFRDSTLHPEKYPAEFIVMPLDADVIREIFSDQRVRLLREVRRRESYDSVDRLARRLRRDRTRVSRDVARLEGYGLLRTTRRGKRKRIEARDVPILLQ